MGTAFRTYWFPLLIIASAIPMVLGILGPNRYFGFRNWKTQSSPAIWYPVNRFYGWLTILFQLFAIAFNLVLWRMNPDWSPAKLQTWLTVSAVIGLLLSFLITFVYLRRWR